MRKYFIIAICTYILILFACSKEQTNVLQCVDPLIGTDAHGHTYPGATQPFGMVQVGPSNYHQGWAWSSGYHFTDTVMQGFAHTHLSGTGLSGLGDILIMPTSGKLQLSQGTDENPDMGYSSRWRHETEKASPGFYGVHLDDYNIDVEVTSSKRVGFHRYTFNTTGEHNIILDPTHNVSETHLDSEVEILSDTEIRGFKHSESAGGNRYAYFYAKFSKPFDSSGVAINDTVILEKKATAKITKAFAKFNVNKGENVEVKVAISFNSYDGAFKNFVAEAENINFDTALQQAQNVWQHHLNKVEVEDENNINKRIFYSALYHSLLVPNLISDVDGKYIVEGKIYEGNENQYSTFSSWDTFRAQHPLLTILEPEITSEIVNSMISRQTVAKIGLPIWELTGHDNGCMPSYTPVSVIVDAVMKDISGINAEDAYEAIRATSMIDNKVSSFTKGELVIPWIKKLNYVPAHIWESCAQTMEYAYQDWCIYQLGKKLGKPDTSYYMNRSQSYLNLFSKEEGFILPKDSLGHFLSLDYNDWESLRPHYITGNIFGYTTFVPHEIDKLIALKGGKEAFCKWIDNMVNDTTEMKGEAHNDVSGFIGRYGHGDEPSHHIPYLYNYGGQPWKTQALVRRIMNEFYSDKPDGLVNNEDCGQMSSWYVMGALGFYSFCPGNNEYALTSPLFNKVTLHLDSGKKIHITADKQSNKSTYIKSLQLNKQKYEQTVISHKKLIDGATLEYSLCDTPNEMWAK